MKRALILVDFQNDFCAEGALEVPGAAKAIVQANTLSSEWSGLVVGTQDWHPREHKSFAVNNPGSKPFDLIEMPYGEQVLWPAHCIARSHGAALHVGLKTERIAAIFRKGMNPEVDSYSGFADANGEPTGLAAYLHGMGVTDVTVCGLATDYCVAATAEGAKAAGFDTSVELRASAGIDPETTRAALDRMAAIGIHLIK
ncbi:MAG TPA: nicotinamidase [Burkholderiales bacterium]